MIELNITPQLNLFAPITDVAPIADRDAYAAAFDAANPHVMELLARLTRRMRARLGCERVGFRAVLEQARWMYRFRTRDAAGFKINNNTQAWYARELMRRYDDLRGVFHTRERHAA